MFGRATITLGIGPHSSYVCFVYDKAIYDVVIYVAYIALFNTYMAT